MILKYLSVFQTYAKLIEKNMHFYKRIVDLALVYVQHENIYQYYKIIQYDLQTVSNLHNFILDNNIDRLGTALKVAPQNFKLYADSEAEIFRAFP